MALDLIALVNSLVDTSTSTSPKVNVRRFRNAEGLLLQLDLPGVAREDIYIRTQGHALSIRAERKAVVPEGYSAFDPEEKNVFTQAWELTDSFALDKIEARLENGVLTLNLPFAPKSCSRQIEIK